MNKKLILALSSLSICFLANLASAMPKSDDLTIKVDGSSTVYPITEAVAEEFRSEAPRAKVTVGISGTGGGFKKFCAGEIDIADASRPIKEKEISLCAKNGIEYVELPVSYDAISIVVNPSSPIKSITTAELKKIWGPAAEDKITKWNQVNPSWPNEPLKLFAPGVDSGTYDYFTKSINGEEGASRGDITSSEDDNVLVQGIANDKNALGFFGLAYYLENQDKVRALGVDAEKGAGPQIPTVAGVEGGTYTPLSRPLFIYVSKKSLERPLIKNFTAFYLKTASELATEVGYVPLPKEVAKLTVQRFSSQTTGSIYAGGKAKKEASLVSLLKQK